MATYSSILAWRILMDKRAWWATVHGVMKSRTRWSDYAQHSIFIRTCFFSSTVQFSSVAQSCLTLCNPMNRSTPGLPVCHQLPELTQTHVHRVSDTIQPYHPLLSPSSAFSIRVFSNESAVRIRWSKYWSFNFSISPVSDRLNYKHLLL